MQLNPLLTVHALVKQYILPGSLFGRRVGAVTAVNAVSFQVNRGEVIGIVGESGCGKSTLARLLLRLIDPTSGVVEFEGRNIAALSHTELRRLRQRMQMVFQDPNSSLNPRHTVMESMEEPFRFHHSPLDFAGRKKRIRHLLDSVSLPAECVLAYPHQLSGGQKQRVNIARALLLEPELLVLDEPTASLDVSVQAQILELLQKLRDRLGLTYVFISHDLALVNYFCDRIIVMYLGTIVEIMPAEFMVPQHPYTHSLMNSICSPDPQLRRKDIAIDGEPSSPTSVPAGCVFSLRCKYVVQRCMVERPQLHPGGQGGAIACHFPLESASTKPGRVHSNDPGQGKD